MGEDEERWIARSTRPSARVTSYAGGQHGLGLGLFGVSGREVIAAATCECIESHILKTVRDIVQTDFFKEDLAYYSHIFSTGCALGHCRRRQMKDGTLNLFRRKVSND